MLRPQLRRLVSLIVTVVTLAIALAVPVGFLTVGLHSEHVTLSFKARLEAGRVAQYVYSHPVMWQYHGPRIADLLQLPDGDRLQQLVTDTADRAVALEGPAPAFPALWETAPIIVAGSTVGWLRVGTSLRTLCIDTLLLAGASGMLALLALVALRSLPIRALDRLERAFGRQTMLFEAALANMTQGLCMVDASGKVAVLNPRFVEMFALAAEPSVIGLDAEALQSELIRAGAVGARGGALLLHAGHDTAAGDHARMVTLPDGRSISVLRRDLTGGGWVATFEDVTSRLRAEAERSRAEAESALMRARAHDAQEVSRAKSIFLATMSHEIRTPMNGVLGLAATLLDGTLTPEQRRVVETIRDSGDSLMQILNDILEFSRLESAQVSLEAVAFDPATLADSVADVLQARAVAKGLSLTLHSDPTLPTAVSGDPGRIRQVLMNLVANAIKFTATGGVTVETGCVMRDDASATLRWAVTDTGIGIPGDKLTGLFREFVQADGSINRRFGGSGLGLAISRRLVECMGGTIEVRSAAGAGSTFRFQLNLPVVQAAAPGNPQARDVVAALRDCLAALRRRPRILVAEDNPTNQFVVRRMLSTFDLQVDTVADGVEAVTAATTADYDLICMDVQMPEMDGMTATRRLRARGGRLATLPIIALTGNAFPEDEEACREAGMTGFLTKPVSKAALYEALLHALASGRLPVAEPEVLHG